jgi:Putative prokaryotic signal transducing protein
MKAVYEASNSVEAHMLQDYLRQEEIPVEVQGEFLAGGVGELPAAGLVRLVADDENYARAKAALERWEKATVVGPAPTVSPTAKKPQSSFFPAFIGLVAGTAITYAFLRVPVTTDGIDFNGDGVLDEVWTYSSSGAMLTTRTDRNLDGKVDFVASLSRKGGYESAESDDDFDGVFETKLKFRMGNIEKLEVDTDRDELANLKSYYKYGVLETTEYIYPQTGLAVRIEHFKLGKVVRADVDTNNDGRLDQSIIYSAVGEVIRTEKIGQP